MTSAVANGRLVCVNFSILRFVIVATLLLLAGCRVEWPQAEAGYFARHPITADSLDKVQLSPAQIQALEKWFAQNQAGWRFKVSDFYPDTWLLLRLPGGREAWFYTNGNELWAGNRVKRLTDEQKSDLNLILNGQ